MSLKISNLTSLNVAAAKLVFPPDTGTTFTATTATFEMEAATALRFLDRAMATMPTRGHPRHSLHALRRKLAAAAAQLEASA